ncbi:MAG TPA: hypothetical protein VGN34_19645 [Ktedonobacteraceae bacterium]
MIWFAWRQYRFAMGIGIALLAVLIPLFILDAQTLTAALQQHHFVHCFDTSADYIPCGIMIIPGNTAQWRTIAGTLLPILPFIVGVFLGAPLLPREYDQRTHLFVWTQSLSPTRWLTIKLVILGGATLIGFGLLSCITTWWGFIQDDIATSPWQTFTIRGSVFVAEALFSLMCGVMIGALLRRTLLSMALTFLLLLLLQGLLGTVYPYLLPPFSQLDYYHNLQQQHLLGKFGTYSQDLILGTQYVGSDGKIVENVHCADMMGQYVYAGGAGCEIIEGKQCLDCYHVKPLVEYQRFDERFWPLQIMTTALLIALTALFTAMTYWQIQRRIL